MKVLFIDDDNSSLFLLKSISKDLNIESTFLLNSEDIYDLDLNEYDLVVTDYLMPKMDGIKVIDYAKSINPNLYFCLITAISDNSLINKAYEYRTIDYIIKPYIKKEQIEHIINEVQKRKERLNLENDIDNKINNIYDI